MPGLCLSRLQRSNGCTDMGSTQDESGTGKVEPTLNQLGRSLAILARIAQALPAILTGSQRHNLIPSLPYTPMLLLLLKTVGDPACSDGAAT